MWFIARGNESRGLRQSIREQCSQFVQISFGTESQNPLLDSLNVSVAAGILLGQLICSRNVRKRP